MTVDSSTCCDLRDVMTTPPPPAIEIHGVSKRYRLSERSLVSQLIPSRRRAAHDVWANHNIDLRIESGETIGLVGRNGSGKSTLLRMLAGVSEPTEGRLIVRGRIAPLISVGVGFHQELTGRENVLVNGMLLGLTKSEVAERFADIVAFAELEDFIDTPVKFYSSGMFMRLGFSVAIHVDPEVLLVDEVLAVGDLAFQLKCFDRMRDLVRRGTTIVLVSHSMAAVELLCPRTLVLKHGEVVFDGETRGAIEEHHKILAAEGRFDPTGLADQVTTGDVEVTGELVSGDGPTAHATQSDELRFVADMHFRTRTPNPYLVFRARSEDGQRAYEFSSPIGSDRRTFEAGERAHAEIVFRPALGQGGTFRFDVTVIDENVEVALGRTESIPLYVTHRIGILGLADLDAKLFVGGEQLGHAPIALSEPTSMPD